MPAASHCDEDALFMLRLNEGIYMPCSLSSSSFFIIKNVSVKRNR
jgi:hypothetical protein